jgi:hypothetical protein
MSDEFELRHSAPVFTQRAAPATMGEAASRPWNQWVTTMIQRAILAHEKALLEGIQEAVSELIETKVRTLETELGLVRADLEIARRHGRHA